MRENAFCMVFHVRWISHHSSPNPTLVATRLGRDLESRGEKNPSHMENHTKCISSYIIPNYEIYIICKWLISILYLFAHYIYILELTESMHDYWKNIIEPLMHETNNIYYHICLFVVLSIISINNWLIVSIHMVKILC